jgi:hypothetical protein
MDHPIRKAFQAETFVQGDPKDEQVRHEQGPVVIAYEQTGAFGDALQALDLGSEVAPNERLQEADELTDQFRISVLQAIEV